MTTPQDTHPPFPELHSARLALLELATPEAVDLVGIYSDPEVARYSDLFLANPEEARAWIRQVSAAYQSDVGLRWGIHLGRTGRLIGTIGFQSIFMSRAEIGFELAKEYWHQGIMSEALELVLSFGMETLGFHRIQAWTHHENEASVRLLLRLGFQEEGRMARACYLGHRGDWIDIRVFALLASPVLPLS